MSKANNTPNHVSRRIGAEYATKTGLANYGEFLSLHTNNCIIAYIFDRYQIAIVSAWIGYSVTYAESETIVQNFTHDEYQIYSEWQQGADLGFNRQCSHA